jgi:hypothetical protein
MRVGVSGETRGGLGEGREVVRDKLGGCFSATLVNRLVGAHRAGVTLCNTLCDM